MKVAIVTNPNIEKSSDLSYKMSERFRHEGLEAEVLDIDNL